MPSPSAPPAPSVDAVVLLVLLPDGVVGVGARKPPSFAGLPALQHQLGTAIRVLIITETSHSAVVHSFHATDLPAFVLMRQGVELWRQRGLPEGDGIAVLLLSKLSPASDSAVRA